MWGNFKKLTWDQEHVARWQYARHNERTPVPSLDVAKMESLSSYRDVDVKSYASMRVRKHKYLHTNMQVRVRSTEDQSYLRSGRLSPCSLPMCIQILDMFSKE